MTGRKRTLAILIVVVAVLGAGVWLGRPMYHHWKERRFLAQGRAFFAKGEYANAWICGVKALGLNSQNPTTYRLLAELTERGKSPQAIYLRRKVVELEPGILENRLAWARTALNIEFFPFPLTAEALASVDEAGRRTAAYHSIAAALALKRNSLSEAEFHLNEAAKLEPQSELLRMNLATVQLRSSDTKVVADAERTLQALRTNATCRLPALRSLVNASLARKKWDEAVPLSAELQADPSAAFADHLLRLAVLHGAHDAQFAGYLKTVQQEATKAAQQAFDLSAWMAANGLADAALAWLQTLPNELRKEHPVPFGIAQVYLAKARWSELDALLRGQQWGAHEYLRLAMLARALQGEGEKDAADVNWRKAVRLASEHAEFLSMLVQMAESWGWKTEVEEALWLVANQFPNQRWALQSLYQTYLARNDTRRMRDVYAALVKQSPEDMVAKNNLAVASFLLKTDLERAHQLAQEIYQKDPKNPSFVSTYAYSLHLQGKTKDGLKILQSLQEQELRKPSIALYYGLMLAAMGDAASARTYLALADKARLLPEERALLASAKQGG